MDLFKLDIQKLRNTSSDVEFRRLLTTNKINNDLTGDFFNVDDFEPYVLELKIGDHILIKTKPYYWNSLLCDNNPLFKLFYPVKGIIEGRELSTDCISLSIRIDNKLYGFDEESLLKVCEILNKKDMNDLKISKEKVIEAAEKCPEGKAILKTLFPEVFEPVYDQNKIYVFKVRATDFLYKIHVINNKFYLIALRNSHRNHSHEFNSFNDLLNYIKDTGELYTFNTEMEFFKWGENNVE